LSTGALAAPWAGEGLAISPAALAAITAMIVKFASIGANLVVLLIFLLLSSARLPASLRFH
jgi:hypothetical protein